MHFSKVFIFAIICIIVQAFAFDDIQQEWQNYMLEYKKKYQNKEEEIYRFNIFKRNRMKIIEHNDLFHDGKSTFTMAINQFSDLDNSEFQRIMKGFIDRPVETFSIAKNYTLTENIKLPKYCDWRNEGAVTAVKNQGHCGSCWAFATAGAIEGQQFRHTGKLVALSEQNLLDCSGKYGNDGCNGGTIVNALHYIIGNRGIDTDISYPYNAVGNYCQFNFSTVGATIRYFIKIPRRNETTLAGYVVKFGPIAAAIDGLRESFQHYSGGIYYEPACNEYNLNHAILIVGFGTDELGNDYWLVKNSWATAWGEYGYARIARNKQNNCGIASMAVLPVI